LGAEARMTHPPRIAETQDSLALERGIG
jgi:hypothetical protein